MNAIELKNIKFKYDSQTPVFNDFNLEIKEGEFVCILGHNGSGKSTLSKIIMGLIEADGGDVMIFGEKLTYDNCYRLRKKIGIVFQNPDNQFVGVTVKDDIAFGLENRCIEPSEIESKVKEYAEKVSMENFLEYNPESLSGGEKQRVAIAGILALNTDVIIFDEATSMLDPKGISEVMDLVNKLKKTKTIILITHNMNEAINCDRVVVLKDGHVVLNDTPKEVFKEFDILSDCKLESVESVKLIQMIEKSNKLNPEVKQKLEEKLWELTFKM